MAHAHLARMTVPMKILVGLPVQGDSPTDESKVTHRKRGALCSASLLIFLVDL
jgi:hypothetical protein